MLRTKDVGRLVLCIQLLLSSPSEVRAQTESTAARQMLDAAIADLETGSHAKAAAQLAELVSISRDELAIESRYHFAKALYRLGFLHSALAEFETVLAEGSGHDFYRASLEWCLFIGRKMVDDVAVNEVLVRHGDNRFPDRYRDEFLFQLARHHYTRALVWETKDKERPASNVSSGDDEGISFEEDLFNDLGGSESPSSAKKKKKKGKRGGSGFSFDEDLFGDPSEPAAGLSDESRLMTREQHLELSRRLATQVDRASPFAPRAQFLVGLLGVQAGQDNKALEAFKVVVELTAKPQGSKESDIDKNRRLRLRELAFFQLARLHFGARQPSFSIFYYRRIDRDSLQWLDALYEASWAEYRLGRYERALGNLLTVNAPFFTDAYFPEALILKAVIYYENCRYREAERIIEGFLVRYEPLFEALAEMAQREREPQDWYQMLAERRSSKKQRVRRADETLNEEERSEQLLTRVIQIALGDPEVRRLDASIREVEAEIGELSRAVKRKPLVANARFEEVLRRLDNEKNRLITVAGAAIERKLQNESHNVRALVAQALRVQVETAKAEEGRLEASLSQRNQRPRRIKKNQVNWTDDEKLIWPFEGEYWRDELGTYELTLARSCR